MYAIVNLPVGGTLSANPSNSSARFQAMMLVDWL
jgi:hypothetical protein